MIESLLSVLGTRLGAAAAVGIGVSASHYAGHVATGDRMSFEDAGVMTAGLTVFAAATVATWVLLGFAGGGA
jgi:hypothetical protein